MNIRDMKDDIGKISETVGHPQGSIKIDDHSRDSGRSGTAISTGRILHPTVFDVLFGRGKPYQVNVVLSLKWLVFMYFCSQGLTYVCHFQSHSGNIRLHKVVSAFRSRYAQARRHEKTEIAEEIVQFIQTTVSPESQPGRFLKRIEEDECWVVVSDAVARDKVSHALRGKPRIEDRASEATAATSSIAGSGSMLLDLLSLKRGNMAVNNCQTMGTLPFADEDGDTPETKRQKLVPQDTSLLNGGGGPSFFRMPASMMTGGNLMMQQQLQQQQFQQQQQQQLLASALVEQQQLASGMAGQAYGGMGFYGNSGQHFANMRGQMQLPSNVGSGGVDPIFLQQLAAERQMRGDPRFWM